MTSARELKRCIESCKLEHEAFMVHYTWLKERIEDALDGLDARVEWIVGPSRAGKSMLFEALVADFPESRNEGIRRVPVLLIQLTRAIPAKAIPMLVMKALNVPIRKGMSETELELEAVHHLKKLGTVALLIDEASHFVEPTARVLPRAAGEMLKKLSDGASLSIFMTGIPRLQLLIDANDQLRQRASAKRELLPYDFSKAHEQVSFAQCVRTYSDMFEEAGWPIDVPFVDLVKNCYLHTGGLIGVLSKLMRELCTRPRDELPRPLSFQDCEQASDRAGGTRHPLHKPFKHELVSDALLNQAHKYILEIEPLPAVNRK